MPAIVTRNVGTVCNRRDERLQARRAIGQRAEALVIGDAIELGRHRLDAAGPIFRERKDRVVEAASEDALIASAHHLVGLWVRVDNGQEGGSQLACRPAQRQIPLMRLHRRHQHALWQVEVALVDRPVDDARPLDEIDHLVEHAAGIVPGCVVHVRQRCQQRLDDFAAIPRANTNAGTAKVGDVVIDRAKLELGLQQTMAAC